VAGNQKKKLIDGAAVISKSGGIKILLIVGKREKRRTREGVGNATTWGTQIY